MVLRAKIGDVMTRNFIYVTPNTPINIASKIMCKKRVGSLIVKEGQKLRGILTEGDIIRFIAKNKSLKNPVKKAMSKRVCAIEPGKDISHAFKIMKRKKIRWLPVVVKKNVIGMLTMKDIFKIQPALSDLISQNIKVAEQKEKEKRVRAVNPMKWVREGPCHECGVYDLLYKVGDKYLCERCKKKFK